MHQNSARKKIWPYLLSFAVILLIINSVFFHQKINPVVFLGFFLSNIFIFSFLLKFYSAKILLIQSGAEHHQEEINIIAVENKKNQEQTKALKLKITRYDNLKKLIEELNRSLKLDTVIGVLSLAVYKLISNSTGVALFYLVDNQYQKLNLAHSIKEDTELVVLSKEGDIFDQWVLRHSSQLIIEDLKNDFRFDADSISSQDTRSVLSLISSPLISNNSLLGLLRLESKKAGFFNQDDLRFLSLVADLGVVALENSLLFQKTQDLAIHDNLTALYTRGYFIDRLKDEARRTQRLDQHLSLMMIDIDFFKQYNDKFGHILGDLVLKKMGILLKDTLKEFTPLICRFGGEEFLVMLSGVDKKKSFIIAEELRQRIQKEKIMLRRQVTHITVSIGVASLSLDTKDEDELVQQADKAMYTAKEKGRNRVCLI
ncbi:MAG: sensor domain-containing diguanylate cyclase [Candidatus Omnitrophica bacterium]|nr:sensor domain-containing diguanylate cyclase [Candidatus Omnitrophota bacterium]MBU4303422.1 sensor domain-containing diguanylate cyclase [Candidatus Omnitrophota bacterium]MBU4467134.1 sensor domain-containing diguanylate cyclase [Candidatus Omnitrophota bacterium]MCG2708095.1 sensor domain-containing diguanylate cyclase [Candidatus Omnitrophota bacterium]